MITLQEALTKERSFGKKGKRKDELVDAMSRLLMVFLRYETGEKHSNLGDYSMIPSP
jgi:hypothetical protein